MADEVELKLDVARGAAEQLHAMPWLGGEWAAQLQLSVYFDTRERDVRRLGYTLRVRRIGDRFVQTVKSLESGAGLFQRGEWECQIDGPEPDLSRLEDTPLARLGAAKLTPLVSSDVTRRSLKTNGDGAMIEIVLDEGEMRAGQRRSSISAIELELVTGEPAALFALARRIDAQLPVELGVMSKAERGFALAEGWLGMVAKAETVPLKPGMTIGEGFACIVSGCLRHFRLNEPLVIEKRQPEALHQARVAIRRLRSALSLFRPAIADAELPRLRDQLRRFSADLGEARNFDVLLIRKMPSSQRRTMKVRREAAYDHVIDAMRSRPDRTLMLDLAAWSTIGEWRGHKAAFRPLNAFASRRIDRLWHRLHHARHVASMDDGERHRLRITVKKLRYALEFMEMLHVHHQDRQRRFAKSLATLQEALGELNDAAIARTLLPSDDWLIGEKDGDHELLRAAERALVQLHRTGPYWSRKA